MSTKNIYLFKVSIRDTQTNTEVPVQLFRGLLREIFDREGRKKCRKDNNGMSIVEASISVPPVSGNDYGQVRPPYFYEDMHSNSRKGE